MPAGSPPYQTVIWFPGQFAFYMSLMEEGEARWFDFIMRSGRALLYPVYKGTYERRVGSIEPIDVRRDLVIQWAKDLGRSVDYLETRQDIDRERLAYLGLSRGAADGPIMSAIEGRLKAGVFWAGGLTLDRRMPEVDPINFAPRVRIPVLMVTSRQDMSFPFEASQLPMFRFLGTPEKDKRHVVFDGNHVPPRTQSIKEILDWLDRYLGRVRIPAS